MKMYVYAIHACMHAYDSVHMYMYLCMAGLHVYVCVGIVIIVKQPLAASLRERSYNREMTRVAYLPQLSSCSTNQQTTNQTDMSDRRCSRAVKG